MSALEYGFYDELEKIASDPRIVQPLLRPKARKFKQLGLPRDVQRKLHETRFARALREGVSLPEDLKFRPDSGYFDQKAPGPLPAGSLPIVRGERFHTRGSADGPELQAADRKAMSRRDIGDFATAYAQNHAENKRLNEPWRLFKELGVGRPYPATRHEWSKHPSEYTGHWPLKPTAVRTPEQEALSRARKERSMTTKTPAQLARGRRLLREELLEARRQVTPRLT